MTKVDLSKATLYAVNEKNAYAVFQNGDASFEVLLTEGSEGRVYSTIIMMQEDAEGLMQSTLFEDVWAQA